MAALGRDRARVAAGRLHDAELVSAGSTLSFVHPIVHEAIASELALARKALSDERLLHRWLDDAGCSAVSRLR